MNRNIIYVSTFFPRCIKDQILQNLKFYISNSADVFSYSIYEGLSSILKNKLEVINVMPLGPFPKCNKKMYYKGGTFVENNHLLTNISCSTVYIYQHFSVYSNLLIELKRKALRDLENIIIVYSLNIAIMKAIHSLKKSGFNIKVILILPDFFEDMYPKNSLSNLIKRKIIGSLSNYYDDVDGFIYLTKYMHERIPKHKPYCVVEGMYNLNENRLPPKVNNNLLKNVVYSGLLHEKFGVKILLDAFKYIDDPNICLHLCGTGDLNEMIKSYSKNDPRIIYHGLITREKVLDLQSGADLLVNPRTPQGDFTRFSFPSKNIEYLVSGVPVLLYKLDGIPDEYYDYCYTLDNVDPFSMAKKIIEILSTDLVYRSEFGAKARAFILESKNHIVQSQKIVKFLDTICNEKDNVSVWNSSGSHKNGSTC